MVYVPARDSVLFTYNAGALGGLAEMSLTGF
jgi:hypothetical protein